MMSHQILEAADGHKAMSLKTGMVNGGLYLREARGKYEMSRGIGGLGLVRSPLLIEQMSIAA